MMHTAETGTLRVPGATLFYKKWGTGPLLLILTGGDGDAEASDGIVEHLADRNTVVTFDRRGLSRSRIDGTAEGMRLETHTDDVHSLLAALTTEPALVFGVSLGALVGLDLVSRYSDQVQILVCHEPPATQLLPDAERARAVRDQEEVEAAFRREGIAAAMKMFVALAGLNFEDREPEVELPRSGSERMANLSFFLTHDAPAVRLYRLDLAALDAAAAKIVVAAGRTSGAFLAHQCAVALAKQLGTSVEEFPGGHSGFVTHPRAFAKKLHEVLDAKRGK
jgi:pimeloyl-ACP methyl ester carboxylesterase